MNLRKLHADKLRCERHRCTNTTPMRKEDMKVLQTRQAEYMYFCTHRCRNAWAKERAPCPGCGVLTDKPFCGPGCRKDYEADAR